MITANDIREKNFKTGIGYEKKDVDAFMNLVASQQDKLLSEISSLKGKYVTLTKALTYYKDLEKSLQKTMIVAQKVADDTIDAAQKKAKAIEEIAKAEGMKIISNANNEYMDVHNKTINLIHQYENYRAQFKRLAMVQFDLINDKSFDISIANLKADADKLSVDVDFEKLYDQYKASPDDVDFSRTTISDSLTPHDLDNDLDNESAMESFKADNNNDKDESFANIDQTINYIIEKAIAEQESTSTSEPEDIAESEPVANSEPASKPDSIAKTEPVIKHKTDAKPKNISKNDIVSKQTNKAEKNKTTSQNLVHEHVQPAKKKLLSKKVNITNEPEISEEENNRTITNDNTDSNIVRDTIDIIPMTSSKSRPKDSNLNLGVIFNEKENDDNLFSLDEDNLSSESPTPNVTSDDEFIFDESSDDDSIGITFDFLD